MKKQTFLNFIVGLLLFFILQHQSIAQSNDSLKINSIPNSLTWNNAPLHFNIANNVVTIVAGPKTDMFRDPNVTYNTDNAPI